MKTDSFRRLVVSILWGLVILAPMEAHPWGATGHKVTTQIAYDRLNPDVKAEVDRLINVLAGYAPEIDHFVPAATWMDELKGHGLKAFNNWHFIDIPYNPYNLPDVAEPAEENVVWAIDQATQTLKSKSAGDFQKALMLRFLIHFVGDVHQPLHCISRYTWLYPDGDRGGNLFLLTSYPGWKPFYSTQKPNLHAFWDDTATLFPSVSSKGWRTKIPGFANQVVKDVPPESVPEWTQDDPKAWALESYQLGVDVVYNHIREYTVPSDDYIQQARSVVRQRLALGGYRLAALLNAVLGKTSDKD